MTGSVGYSGDEHVLRRLNSPERKALTEEARRIHEEARVAFESGPLPGGAAYQATKSRADRPKTMTEILFNGVTGFMGLPGLADTQYDPHTPNADQGLGFHQDGTARRADGTTGNNAASANFDGRRADGYMGHGLGYGNGRYGGSYGSNAPGGWYGAGYDPHYDPMPGYNYRLGDMSTRRPSSMRGYGMFDMADPQRYFMQRGLNYGLGFLNSMGEAAFTGLTDKGRARFNFMVDLDGRVNGEGDVLYPFYDGQYTTVFTQVGARSMSGMSGGDDRHGRAADRWIGNFGLGQRWYPAAIMEKGGRGGADGTTLDSGNWMVGYNIFFDNDFTRSHQRGGLGLEAQYDWLKLAANYYFPLSGWKGSYDFDRNFVEERPAQGWDVRVKGALPFYRNLVVTGAYTQWYGDHVSMFSTRKLEKDPRVWSYGLEYTPVPLVSAFWNQRSTERGRNDTEFGLRLTYHFDMPFEKQLSHAKVAAMRTVSASRHEFVDRENRIILEYRAKDNYYIEFVGRSGDVFTFRLKHSFDGYVAGQTVRVSASGVMTLAEAGTPSVPASFLAQAGEFLDRLFSVRAAHAADLSNSYVTDRNGEFRVTMTGLEASGSVTVKAGNSTRVFTAAELGGDITCNLDLYFDAFLEGATWSYTLPPQCAGVSILSYEVNVGWGNVVLSQCTIIDGKIVIVAASGLGTVDIHTTAGTIRVDNFGA